MTSLPGNSFGAGGGRGGGWLHGGGTCANAGSTAGIDLFRD